MAFPNRAIIVAPLGRDLSLEVRDTVMVPGANNGVKQLWDTLDQDAWVAKSDADLSGYGTVQSVPNALKRYLIQVRRYDSVLALEPSARWARFVDCGALDFLRVVNNGVVSVKAASTLVAGDRPTEWDLLHRWLGNIAETLGDEA